MGEILKQHKSVIVGLSGGLGNQMFQYAAGRSLAIRLRLPLALDLSWFGARTEREFALNYFCIQAQLCSQFALLPPKFQGLVSRIYRRWLPFIMGVPVLREPYFHFMEDWNLLSGPTFLEGYWQSEHYFLEIATLLQREFCLKQPLPLDCSILIEEINSFDSICVHVRRGDYISNPVAAKIHGTCSLEYYRDGIRELSQGLKRPRVFVFSDDPAWARNNLCSDIPLRIVDINGPQKAHLDLSLMAACKHFLIANSSLSWWGAWLGKSFDKKVIAPARWFQSQDQDVKDLLPNNWQRR